MSHAWWSHIVSRGHVQLTYYDEIVRDYWAFDTCVTRGVSAVRFTGVGYSSHTNLTFVRAYCIRAEEKIKEMELWSFSLNRNLVRTSVLGLSESSVDSIFGLRVVVSSDNVKATAHDHLLQCTPSQGFHCTGHRVSKQRTFAPTYHFPCIISRSLQGSSFFGVQSTGTDACSKSLLDLQNTISEIPDGYTLVIFSIKFVTRIAKRDDAWSSVYAALLLHFFFLI